MPRSAGECDSATSEKEASPRPPLARSGCCRAGCRRLQPLDDPPQRVPVIHIEIGAFILVHANRPDDDGHSLERLGRSADTTPVELGGTLGRDVGVVVVPRLSLAVDLVEQGLHLFPPRDVRVLGLQRPDRLLVGEIAAKFPRAMLAQPEVKALLSARRPSLRSWATS